MRHWTGNEHYSRSYAKDVTSVTFGASQGPHSFNSVFVPSACLAVSRTCPVPYHQRQLVTIFKQGFQMQDHNVKQLGKMSMYAKCIRGMHAGQ